ncbi:PEBP-like protein [Phanerochaete sordida]|uniref:PEBP-like protein n=1 Tax=Phanerochaete sordida TaxID=48140 RepID=A0A9P3GBE5_9APHY|nr:PEBP-like protein [Phanerochaete sordida]
MRGLLLAIWLLCTSAAIFAQDTSLKAVEAAFKKANITKDLQITFKPSVLLDVIWPEPGFTVPTRTGETLQQNETAGPPRFAVHGILPEVHKFVVAAVDPDALTPQNPNVSQIRHLLQGNVVRGPTVGFRTHLLVNETPAVTDWIQPAPGAGSAPHRYVFLLYKQPKGYNNQTFVAPNDSIPAREFFNISQFAQEVGMGDPIAGSFVLVGPGP